MNNRLIKLLKNILIVSLACGIFIFSIVSLDYQHITICKDSHCCLCSAIDFCQKVVMVIVATVIVLHTILFLVAFFLAELYERLEKKVFLLNTLVNRKIQFNE